MLGRKAGYIYFKGGKMIYNIAIIGAGVIGSLTAQKLSKYKDVSVCLIDRNAEPAGGTSKANSAIVHAGYDAVPGTLKAKFNVKGCRMMEEICTELGVGFKKNGSLVVAFDDDIKHLNLLLQRGEENGVDDLRIIGRDELLTMEPNINPDIREALYAPGAGIVNPYELACAAAENAADNGVETIFDFNVKEIKQNNGIFDIVSESGTIKAEYVINCAGVYADDFAKEPGFEIKPRKGEYLLLDRKYGSTVNHVLFQTPTERGKGILVTPTVHGNLLLGPTSVFTNNKEDTETTKDGIDCVICETKRIVPSIDVRGVITSFAGVRATPNTHDFLIGWSTVYKNQINAAGIESPGLTAAPAIAEYIASLLKEKGVVSELKENIIKRRPYIKMSELSLDEQNELIRQDPAYGRIVCRCECISEGEIVDAVRRNAGARTVDGVKKRVRAGMGRCQGSFCLPNVLRIISRELGIKQTELTKSGGDSIILTGISEH